MKQLGWYLESSYNGYLVFQIKNSNNIKSYVKL
jgi:hypothetical protein